jgi:hypothetical protein
MIVHENAGLTLKLLFSAASGLWFRQAVVKWTA